MQHDFRPMRYHYVQGYLVQSKWSGTWMGDLLGKLGCCMEEVLVRQAGGAHPAVCVVLMPQYSDRETSIVFRMRR